MSITDELRKFAWKECPSKFLERVTGIADDIDKKHEAYADFAHRMKDAASKGEEVTIFGTDYIPLPKDADGEAIHLQDRMVWDNGSFNVHELKLTAAGWTTWDELHGYTVRADQCRHVKPDSWEAIIEDAAKNIYPNGAFNPCWDEVRDELVERCKRLAGEE